MREVARLTPGIDMSLSEPSEAKSRAERTPGEVVVSAYTRQPVEVDLFCLGRQKQTHSQGGRG